MQIQMSVLSRNEYITQCDLLTIILVTRLVCDHLCYRNRPQPTLECRWLALSIMSPEH
eukprot:COSAG02_NODE_66212_length_256_cov_0.643312_1_plen_57_part_01